MPVVLFALYLFPGIVAPKACTTRSVTLHPRLDENDDMLSAHGAVFFYGVLSFVCAGDQGYAQVRPGLRNATHGEIFVRPGRQIYAIRALQSAWSHIKTGISLSCVSVSGPSAVRKESSKWTTVTLDQVTQHTKSLRSDQRYSRHSKFTSGQAIRSGLFTHRQSILISIHIRATWSVQEFGLLK
jgi:hypothetical protein